MLPALWLVIAHDLLENRHTGKLECFITVLSNVAHDFKIVWKIISD